MSPHPDPTQPLAQEFTLTTLRAATAPRTWLWHGYLSPGAMTLLTSQWKSGKTTLLSILLSRLARGGLLAGGEVRPARAAVLSEEMPAQWAERSQTLDLGDDHHRWICRPFLAQATAADWSTLLDRLEQLHRLEGITLAVIDSLAYFLPGHWESNPALMLQALMPLQRLTRLGMAVLLLHHPRKAASDLGSAARGSGALTAFVDVLIEMDWHARRDPANRRRRLAALSRFPETPTELVIEWSPDGTDYTLPADAPDEEFSKVWDLLHPIFEHAHRKLTRRDILNDWPESSKSPEEGTLWRWLDRAVGQGLLRRDGLGFKSRPYRYWLPTRENDPGALFHTPDLDDLIDQIRRAPLPEVPHPRPERRDSPTDEVS